MANEESYHSLLLQKKELIFKLLRLSNDAALADPSPEKNAENYIRLVETRKEIIDELKRLDIRLESAEFAGMSEDSALPEQEMKEMVGQIIRLETDIRKKASGLLLHFRRELKKINDRKKTSSGEYTPGMLYESKV